MMTHRPTFTRLTMYEVLTLAAEAEASGWDGNDAKAELRRRLAELRARRHQRWVEEWLIDPHGWG
jgi:hypothetical protein